MRKVIGAEAPQKPPFELYYQTAPIEGIDDLHGMLNELRSQPQQAALRGEPLEYGETPQRRLLDRTIVDVPRAWLMLDVDSSEEPDGVDFKSEPARCAEYLRAQLPQAFHTACCVWRASGSAGFKSGIRLNLWFLLDQPLTGEQCKAWLSHASVQVDHSVFGAVHLHYTADPDLGGAEDPMSARIGQLPGDVARVRVPDMLPELARPPRSSGVAAKLEPSEMKPRPVDAHDLPDDNTRSEQLQARIEELWECIGTTADGRVVGFGEARESGAKRRSPPILAASAVAAGT